MQGSRRHKKFVKKPLVSTLETLPEGSLPRFFTREEIQQVCREEFSKFKEEMLKMMHSASSQNGIALLIEKEIPPFDEWKLGKELLDKFFRQSIHHRFLDGEIDETKNDGSFKLNVDNSNPKIRKYICLIPRIELCYKFYHVINTYSALPPFGTELFEIIANRFLFRSKGSGKLKSVDSHTISELYSRVWESAKNKTLTYPRIDRMLHSVFKKVD